MTTFQETVYKAGKPVSVTLEIKYVKREAGSGYDVVRKDNGHRLGWVQKEFGKETWESYSSNDAHYPAGTDLIDRLDRHPDHLAKDAFHGAPTDTGAPGRNCATSSLVFELVRQNAEVTR